MWKYKDDFYWIKEQSGHVWVVIKHVQKGKCALLERGDASTCELIHDLICGSLLSTSTHHVADCGRFVGGGSLCFHTWNSLSSKWCAIPLHLVCPPLLGIFTFGYLYKLSPIAIQLEFGDCCLQLYYCNTFHLE